MDPRTLDDNNIRHLRATDAIELPDDAKPAPIPAARLRTLRRITIGVSVALTLLVVELALRLMPEGTTFDDRVRLFSAALVEDDPDRGHRLRPASETTIGGVRYRTAADGCRGAEASSPPRVLVVGDSVTMGWGVPEAAAYPAALGDRIGGGVRNCGVLGYGALQSVLRAEALIQRDEARPDIVILGYYPNDPEDRETTVRRSWILRSRLARFLAPRARSLARRAGLSPDAATYYRSLHEEGGEGWARVQGALERLSTTCGERQIRCVVALLPAHIGDPYPLADVHAQVAALATQLGLDVIDLAPAVAGLPWRELWVAPDDYHPNAQAHTRFAEALAEWLAAQGIAGTVGPQT